VNIFWNQVTLVVPPSAGYCILCKACSYCMHEQKGCTKHQIQWMCMGPYHAHPYVFYSISSSIYNLRTTDLFCPFLALHDRITILQTMLYFYTCQSYWLSQQVTYTDRSVSCVPHGCENVVVVCGGTMGHTITSLAQLETGQQKWALNLLLHMMHTGSGWSGVFICNPWKKCYQIMEKKKYHINNAV
jgi:hypothetical protein